MALSKIDVANMLTGTIPVDNSKSGSILQVQSTFYNTPFSQSISADTDTSIGTSNLKVDITPTSTSSKIFLFGRLFQEWGNASGYNVGFFLEEAQLRLELVVQKVVDHLLWL